MRVVAFCLNKVSAGSKKKEKRIRLNIIQKIIATERDIPVIFYIYIYIYMHGNTYVCLYFYSPRVAFKLFGTYNCQF